MKERAAKEIGIQFIQQKLPNDISQHDLVRKVKDLNDNYHVHGIIVQMPLPSHIDEGAVVEAIDPRKDVDG